MDRLVHWSVGIGCEVAIVVNQHLTVFPPAFNRPYRWFGAVGTFYASPGILSRRKRTSSQWDIARFIPSPNVCNQALIGVPIVNAISIIIVTVFLGRSWHMLSEQVDRTTGGLAALAPTDQITAAQRAQALEIWEDFMHLWRLGSIGFYMWGGWAFLLLILYLPSGAHLVHTLQVQINEHKTLKNSRFRPNNEPTDHISGSTTRNPAVVPSGATPVWDASSKLETSLRPDERNYEAEMEATRAAESVFFPPLKAERVSLHPQESSAQLKTLRSAFRNIVLMWGSISSAVFAYGVLCLYAASAMHPKAEEGPHALAALYELYNKIAGWLACIFGGLNFVWITSRTFEPVLDGLQLKYAASGTKTHRGTITTFFTSSRPNLGRPVLRPTRGRRQGQNGEVLSDAAEGYEGLSNSRAVPSASTVDRTVALSTVEEGATIDAQSESGIAILNAQSERRRSANRSEDVSAHVDQPTRSPRARQAAIPVYHGRPFDDDFFHPLKPEPTVGTAETNIQEPAAVFHASRKQSLHSLARSESLNSLRAGPDSSCGSSPARSLKTESKVRRVR